jgi:hypothetical protein
MVINNIQSEILLELVFSAFNDGNHEAILKKSLPIYVKKLNCFLAGVLMKNQHQFTETMLIPYVAKKSEDWNTIKNFFVENYASSKGIVNQITYKNNYYYAYNLNTYGLLILGRKNPFNFSLLNELIAIVNHLGKSLIQAKEIEKRIATEKLLRESEESLRSLSDSTSASILIYNTNGIIYANPAAEKFTGYSSNELIKLPLSKLIHPSYIQLVRAYNPIRKSTYTTNATIEVQLIVKNGKKRWANINSGLIKWKGEEAVIISAFDITKRKKTERKLIFAKDEAEKSERLKSAFLANMSHEIRTPMNGILGFSELLKTPNLTNEKQLKYIDVIEKSGARMLNLINDILDISKIEANLMKTSLTKVHVNETLKYLLTFFKLEAAQKGIVLSVKYHLPNSEASITTDKEKFTAILTNLIKNAIKYTPNGTIEVGYTLTPKNMLEFYVKDTGIGIPKDRQKAVFERFIQADIDDKQALQGAGLGLSISKAYVEMLRGKIWVSSKKNKGTTFYFSVPYTKFDNEIEKENQKGSIKPKEMRKIKILITEDDFTSKLLIITLLESFCSEILEASNGLEAVEICKNNPDIDLILMDIKMPKLNGYEATKQIRAFNKSVVIIAQTAYSMVGDKEKAIEAGCNDYISKPINNDELTSLINKHCTT